MKISNIKLPGTFAELETTAYGYKVTNTSSDAIIAKKGNLESRTYFPIVRTDEGSNVLGEYKSLKEAVLKMETEICMEVEFGVWSEFAEEELLKIA